MRPRALLLAALVAASGSAALAAQVSDDEWLARCREERGWGGGRYDDRYAHCEVRTDSLRAPGGAGALRVDPGQNGAVAIRGWDEDHIVIRARIQAYGRSAAEAEEVARQVRIVASGADIHAEGPERRSGRHRSWTVAFEVSVPRRTDLSLETENGPLSVRDVAGRMDLATQNGPLSLRGVGGNVRARVQNGPLTVVLTGAQWNGDGLDAEAVNGPVDLVIPEGYSARLETGTVNGPMSVDFPLTVTIQGRVSHRISTTLGAGGAPVRVVTTNGPLSIRRR